MSYCLNPNCQKADSNPTGAKFCQSCGSKLLLKQRYRAIELIGQGGFGKTFLAIDEDKPSKPRCVIKQFLPQALGTRNAQKAAELFEQEAVRLDELGKNPQIPELFAHFGQDNYQYLVQEFIDGQNLAQLVALGAFKGSQIRHLLNSLLPVLQFIHDRHVIHRDIKPENIIRRSNGQLVLVDFGAAKRARETTLRTGTVIGSAGYVAPEQAMGKAEFASDLYSLGVTCIHLLTQQHPFELFSIREDDWVWRDYSIAQVSSQLGQVLDKMLARATSRRYASAVEVLKDLNADLNQLTAKPSPPAVKVATTSLKPQTWRCIHTLTGHSYPIAISPDSHKLISFGGHQAATIKVWDLQAGKVIFPLTCNSGYSSIALSPDGQTLATCERFVGISFWNIDTGELLYKLSGQNPIIFSHDGQILVSGSADSTIKVWNLQTRKLLHTLSGHSGIVDSLAIGSGGQILTSYSSHSSDRTIKVWDLQTGTLLHALPKHSFSSSCHLYQINCHVISPDGETLVTGGSDGTIKIWELKTGKLIHALSGYKHQVGLIAIGPDRYTLVSCPGGLGTQYEKVKLWNLLTGELLYTLIGEEIELNSDLNYIAISPDGQTLASGSHTFSGMKWGCREGTMLWDLKTGKPLHQLSGHSSTVGAIALSPDGKTLASGSQDKTIKIWRCD